MAPTLSADRTGHPTPQIRVWLGMSTTLTGLYGTVDWAYVTIHCVEFDTRDESEISRTFQYLLWRSCTARATRTPS